MKWVNTNAPPREGGPATGINSSLRWGWPTRPWSRCLSARRRWPSRLAGPPGLGSRVSGLRGQCCTSHNLQVGQHISIGELSQTETGTHFWWGWEGWDDDDFSRHLLKPAANTPTEQHYRKWTYVVERAVANQQLETGQKTQVYLEKCIKQRKQMENIGF